MTAVHLPVLFDEIMTYLQPQPGKHYVDATVGYAGHTLGLLGAGAEVTGIDQDQAMLKLAVERVGLAGYADRFTPVHSTFSAALSGLNPGTFDGVLFDLGVSSYQLDTPSRGFSFRFDSPLDMRMDPDHQSVTAAHLVNGLGVQELTELFSTLGEEPRAPRFAREILRARQVQPILTTSHLVRVIESVTPRFTRLHPATKIFQALRMAVNGERSELQAALPSAWNLLSKGGVMVVVSFHSLEDRPVKAFFSTLSAQILTPKPLTPGVKELSANPRARSAKLRAARKLSG